MIFDEQYGLNGRQLRLAEPLRPGQSIQLSLFDQVVWRPTHACGYLTSASLERWPMKKALKQLINSLDKIFETDEEVGDTAVREAMYDAVHKSFIAPQAGYELPAEFGMFSPTANKKVRAAL